MTLLASAILGTGGAGSSSALDLGCVFAACAVSALIASSASAYTDNWGWKTCSGCELQDPGGYHDWTEVTMSHVGGSAMKRSCALAWNGGAWEYGSGCDEGRSETHRAFPYGENALAVAQGWSEGGGELTIESALWLLKDEGPCKRGARRLTLPPSRATGYHPCAYVSTAQQGRFSALSRGRLSP